MLLYALLHLTGYDLPMAELRRFRQLGSKTPGHPEIGCAPGVETTTGPLGQGGLERRRHADIVAAADLDGVAIPEIAGPGFINLIVDPSLLSRMLAEAATDARLGVAPVASRRCLVDYSAPNVAKELHIGHVRSTIIGDALVRMLTFLGHEVVRENHIGDWGRPFGILIQQLVELGLENDDDVVA